MYVRAKNIAQISARYVWQFRTKLQLAVQQMLRLAELAKSGRKTVWVVADGTYAKRPFLQPLRAAAVTELKRGRS